ncbi:MAG: hypothetical protein KGL39_35435 [Patescibacteria group bacterium]|nr:hypothetical protein [Patescibacteria group bacterium]
MMIPSNLVALTARFLLCSEECLLLRKVPNVRTKLLRKLTSGANMRFAFRLAVIRGWVDVMDATATNNFIKANAGWICNVAASSGFLRSFKWAVSKECDFAPDANPRRDAARAGRLNILRWYCRGYLNVNAEIDLMAAAGGHIHVLEWLIKRRYHWWTEFVCWEADRYRQTAVLDWLKANGCCRCDGRYH